MKILRMLLLGAFIIVFCFGNVVEVHADKLDELIKQLGGKDSSVWSKAVQELTLIGGPAVEPLIVALKNKDWIVRENAAKALGKIGDKRAVEPLIFAIKDDTGRVRYEAIEALGEIGDLRAVEPLMSLLLDQNEKGSPLRTGAATALGKIGDKRAIEPLISALSYKEQNIRKAASESLNKFGWRPENENNKVIFFIANQEWDKCVEMGESAVEPLIAALKYGGDTRKEAAIALGKIGDKRAVEPLIVVLNDKFWDANANAAGEAAWALGEIGDQSAVKPLITMLKGRYRSKAGEALGKIGQPAVKPLIAASIDADTSEALTLIGSPAVEPLIDALKHKNYAVRMNAAKALCRISDKRAVGPLIIALKTPDSSVRKEAVEALGKFGSKSAVEPIIFALSDDDKIVRQRAAVALGMIGDQRAVEPLISAAFNDTDSIVKKSSDIALLKLKDQRALDVYINILDSDNSEMRLRAAKILFDLKNPRAKEVQPKILKVIEEDSYIIEETKYDQYRRPAKVILTNIEGELIAERKRHFNQYNPMQITEEITFFAGKPIHTTNYDLGKSKNSRWLCIDKDGNIIKKWRKPVLVNPFRVEQKSIYGNVYHGAFMDRKVKKIYPCKNCSEETRIKKCKYVW